jgi:tyrosine-protein kinase Etk/Wzc
VSQLQESTREINDTAADQILRLPRERDLSLLDVFIVLAKRRRLIATMCFGFALAAAVISLILPARYTAMTSILPPQQNSSISAAMMAQFGAASSLASMGGGGSLLKNPNDLQVSMLKSRTVEDAIVDRFHLLERYHLKYKSDGRHKLENLVDIESGTKDPLIRISVTERDSQFATDVANGYVEEFKKFSGNLAVTEAGQRRLFFEDQLKLAKDNLANAEEDLKKTEQKTGLIQVDAQTRATIQLVAELRAQIAAKETQIAAMRSYSTGENPNLQIAEQELAGLHAQAAKIGATSENVSNAVLPKGNMQEASIEYVRKLRDVKYYETVFELLARQLEVAKVDEARQGAVIQVVDKAVLPDRRSFPKRTLIVLGAALLGLFIGVVWAFISEAMNRLANDPVEGQLLATLKELLSFRKQGRGRELPEGLKTR